MIFGLIKRYCIKIIQVYASTTNQANEEVDLFYDDEGRVWEDQRTQFTFPCEDFNAKFELKSTSLETSLEGFGTECRNDHGEMLLGFPLQNNLFLMNSCFYKK